MAVAGYGTTVKVSGQANAVTNEATSSLGGGVYQVTNTARRIWDPNVAITIKDGGVTVGAGFYSYDYLFGKVTFSGYSPGGAITVDGSYLSMLPVAEVRSHSLSIERELLESTTYDATDGWRRRIAGLLDVSGEVECLAQPTADLDAGLGGDQSLRSFLLNGTPKLVEFGYGGKLMRGWVLLESEKSASEFDGLVSFNVSFKAASQRAGASFSLD